MIYITGATGHIGNNLVRKLTEQNLDFKILARSIHRSINGFEEKTIIGDVFSEDFLEANLKNGDVLVHLAAYINLKNDKKELTNQINFIGTKMIADFCVKNNIYLVFTSSSDAIANENYLIEEPKNITIETLRGFYQKSKALSTNYILDLINKNKIQATILYPTAVLGINDFKPSAIGREIKRNFKTRLCFYFHGGYNFVDVEDVSMSIIALVKERKTGSYIISGEYISLYKMYKMIFKTLNRKVMMIKIPLYLIKLASKIIPKYRIMIEALLADHNYRNKKMVNELNIKPENIITTLEKTINWFKEDDS